MRTRNAIVDFDETLAPTILALFRFIARRLGRTVYNTDMDSYISWEERFGVDTETIERYEAEFYRSKEYLSMNLDPDAVRVLRLLVKDPDTKWVDILTARHEMHQCATEALLNGNRDLFRTIYHVKNDRDGYRCKVSAYADKFEQAFMFVDDTVRYTVKAAMLYPSLHVFLLDRPWNHDELRMYEHSEMQYDNLFVVKDWKRIGELIIPMIRT